MHLKGIRAAPSRLMPRRRMRLLRLMRALFGHQGAPEVQYAAVTTGAYDVFLWVALGSPEELSSFLRTRVGSIDGVRRTETFVNLSIKKNPAGPSSLGSDVGLR